MAPIALLDVNVLVALFDPDHVHHDLAHDWFADQRSHGWATCPITEMGLVRVLSNPKYRPDAYRPAEVAGHLRAFCDSGFHHFWPDQVSVTDEHVFTLSAARGSAQITDVYLLGLAIRQGGALATFDRSIPLASVPGATHTHLRVIAPVAPE
jgi:toxin-antitoxin system PIN domain toxin